ncbi:hypothetical protein VTL71DRAFT_8318, partial [Oculimacula yallundae]
MLTYLFSEAILRIDCRGTHSSFWQRCGMKARPFAASLHDVRKPRPREFVIGQAYFTPFVKLRVDIFSSLALEHCMNRRTKYNL